jgi:hypothetical protein
MTKLSPQAQAVMDAVMGQDGEPYPLVIAAALQAAALYCKRDKLQLLAIADELESQ